MSTVRGREDGSGDPGLDSRRPRCRDGNGRLSGPDQDDDSTGAVRGQADGTTSGVRLSDPQRGILNDGEVFVEVPNGALIRDALLETGWQLGEEWTPLTRDLGAAVEEPGLRIDVVGPDQLADRVAVGRASFDNSTFCDEQWHSMAGGAAYADARCLVGYGEADTAVAMVTVWSAGEGKPGLIEPLGVHRDHRGHGYGRSICYAAAAALQRMGSSSVQVCTPSSNVVAVAAYVSAGFEKMPLRRDLRRGAMSESTSKV